MTFESLRITATKNLDFFQLRSPSVLINVFLCFVVAIQFLAIKKTAAKADNLRWTSAPRAGTKLGPVSGLTAHSEVGELSYADNYSELVISIAPACPSCQKNANKFRTLISELKPYLKTSPVLVCRCSIEEARAFARAHGLDNVRYVVEVSHRTYVDYSIGLVPRIVLVDRQSQKVLLTREGGEAWDAKDFLRVLVNEKHSQ